MLERPWPRLHWATSDHSTDEVELNFRKLISLPSYVNVGSCVLAVTTFRGIEPCLS